MSYTDWLELWRELAEAFIKPGPHADEGMVERYRAQDRGRALPGDSLLDVVLARIGAETSVLEVGAGTGRWTIPLARVVRQVTALEPSAGLGAMLRANLDEAGVGNVTVVPSGWQGADVAPHDVAVAAHSMYTSPDLTGFVRFMEAHARAACYMELRIPPADGVIGELSRRVHGIVHDSPNAVIAFNALYEMNICANVLIEDEARHPTSATFEEAVDRARSFLRLDGSSAHDELIRATLAERLTPTAAGYQWPDGKRSALLWWEPSRWSSPG